MGRQRLTDFYWDPYPVRPSGGARYDTLPIPEAEQEEVAKRERERKERGFGFAPVPSIFEEPACPPYPRPDDVVWQDMPQLWEGDQA